jgi:hypothetical protein
MQARGAPPVTVSDSSIMTDQYRELVSALPKRPGKKGICQVA